MSTLNRSQIASNLRVDQELHDEFDIQEFSMSNDRLPEATILILDSLCESWKLSAVTKLIILASVSTENLEFKKFWMQCYLDGVEIILTKQSDSKTITQSLIYSLERLQHLQSQKDEQLAVLSYHHNLIHQLSHQESELKQKLELLKKTNQDLEKVRMQNKSLQQLGLQLIRCHEEAQIEALVQEYTGHYINPRAQAMIDQTKDRVRLEKDRLIQQQIISHTLRAIRSPAVIINSSYQVIASNLPRKESQTSCYQLLFNRVSPCTDCHLGKTFFTQNKSTLAISNLIQIHSPTSSEAHYFNLYQDQSDLLSYQIEVSESQKLNDLSVISASIAHELNNPLAGMLSYAQLLKMSLSEQDPLMEDLNFIEVGIKRARDIVNQLLIFTRGQFVSKDTDLETLLQAAIAMAGLNFYQAVLPNHKVEIDLESALNQQELLLVSYITKHLVTQLLDTVTRENLKLSLFTVSVKSNTSTLTLILYPLPEILATEMSSSSAFTKIISLFNGQYRLNSIDHGPECSLDILFRRLDF